MLKNLDIQRRASGGRGQGGGLAGHFTFMFTFEKEEMKWCNIIYCLSVAFIPNFQTFGSIINLLLKILDIEGREMGFVPF